MNRTGWKDRMKTPRSILCPVSPRPAPCAHVRCPSCFHTQSTAAPAAACHRRVPNAARHEDSANPPAEPRPVIPGITLRRRGGGWQHSGCHRRCHRGVVTVPPLPKTAEARGALLGQVGLEHSRASAWAPRHSAQPWAETLHLRVRCWVPLAQVTEQRLQAPHSSHCPSTAGTRTAASAPSARRPRGPRLALTRAGLAGQRVRPVDVPSGIGTVLGWGLSLGLAPTAAVM